MLILTITKLDNYEYQIALKRGVFIEWQTICPEIDLEETTQKVLRVSDNLRKVPQCRVDQLQGKSLCR